MCSHDAYSADGIALYFSFFFFNDTATTEIYTLSLHDALPIYVRQDAVEPRGDRPARRVRRARGERLHEGDRKSTRLNSSHSQISYAVFCLKKKKTEQNYSCQESHLKLSILLCHRVTILSIRDK